MLALGGLKRRRSVTCLALLVLIAAQPAAGAAAPSRDPQPAFAEAAIAESIEFDPFGRVAVYRQSLHPRHVALLLSGMEGWSGAVIEIARALAAADALVLGIDLPRYVSGLGQSWSKEAYASADLELLSQFAQKKLGLPGYVQPVLVGYTAGATLAYAALAQANPNTFRGAISLSFCPALHLPKPLGHGRSLEWQRDTGAEDYRFLPARRLQGRWIVLQGARDQVCPAAHVAAYVRQVSHGKIRVLPGVDRELATGQWGPDLREAFRHLAGVTTLEEQMVRPAAVEDLPLVEVPATGPATTTLAVIVSGDGGWASIDHDIGNALASHGIAVVGLNSLRYFWTRRTPNGAAADLARIVRHYLGAWRKEHVVLMGYSRGADVLPFLANRLPPDLLRRVRLVVLMGPELTVDFEFHLSDWIGRPARATELPVQPEVEKLRGTRILCVYGEEETDSLCPKLDPDLAARLALPGGHHFGGDYDAIVERILRDASIADPNGR